MKNNFRITLILIMVSFCSLNAGLCAFEQKSESDSPDSGNVLVGKNTLSSNFNDNSSARIFKRTEIEHEASNLARQGYWDKALARYNDAMEPSLLNYDYDIFMSLAGIRDIYQRQGKLELALKEHQWFLRMNPTKDQYIDKQHELRALIHARDAKTNKPIYAHIEYLRTKYKKYIPPKSKGDSMFHTTPIDWIIHLYDWMGDADGGIKFMGEVLSSKTLYPNERKEYERVKAAFEEDKHTGQKGHLQKVVETSDFISW